MPLNIAYLAGQYARPSDTFIRAEVAALRDMGHTVHTFSIRRPWDPPVDEEVAAERARTDDVLGHGPWRLAAAAARRSLVSPGRTAAALGLAVRAGWPGLRGRAWPLAYLIEATYLAERLEALEVDFLYNHLAQGSSVVAMLASELSGVPFGFVVHGPHEFDEAPLLALDLKVERAAVVVASASFVRAQLLRWCRPEHWAKVHLVRNGVPGALLEQPRLPVPAEPRFVSVGRVDEQKGHLLLVDAVAELTARGVEVEVEIVGDGPLRGLVERRIEDLDVVGRVRVLGFLSRTAMVERILAARALVMPSLAEGLPLAIMDALAVGRPAIATAVAGVPELVETGVCGWLVPAGDPDPLARAMEEAAAAPTGELERLGHEGTSRVAERHDIRREAARLAELMAAQVR